MMDELINQLLKLLSYDVVVHIYSYPHFAIEALLATVLCIVHCVLIFEINNLCIKTNAKLTLKCSQLGKMESCSDYIISRLHTRIFPQTSETTTTRQSYNVSSYRLNKKLSTTSSLGWDISSHYVKSGLMMRHSHGYNDRVDDLLSISLSGYVQKDIERKHREAIMSSCIQSLTLLEKVFNDDNITMESVSKEAIKKSINAIKDNFEKQFIDDGYSIVDVCLHSLPSLLNHSLNKEPFENSLVPYYSVSSPRNGTEKPDDYKERKSLHNKVDKIVWMMHKMSRESI
ncbi:hypothetical protein JTB14_034198 [Gonioctena quinquepunctata]|nr:hypothetical protein JTB14_034198 [Gonioctena quinquepunctata]